MIDKTVWIIEARNYSLYEDNTNEVVDVSLISVEDAMNKCELACKNFATKNGTNRILNLMTMFGLKTVL